MANYRIVEYEDSFHGTYYELHKKVFLWFWMKVDESLFVDILEREIKRRNRFIKRKEVVREYGT